MKKILLALLAVLAVSFANAQDTVRMRGRLEVLCSPDFHGRGYAYQGDSIAADYLRGELMKIGVMPYLSNDYFHRYTFNTYAMEGEVSAELNGKKLVPWTDFSLAPFSESAHNSFNLLPITAEKFLNKWELTNFCDSNWQIIRKSLLYIDISNLKDNDSLQNIKSLAWFYVIRVPMPFRGVVFGVSEIPVWSFATAHEESNGILAYVKSDLVQESGGTIKLSYTNQFVRNYPTQNVCAMVPGVEFPDTTVVICAHYDHLGQMGEDVVFPGCHDNASGTAALLEFAHSISENPLPYTAVFLFFSGEEAGLKGSTAFVRDSMSDFSKVKLLLNLDLMCGGDDGIMVVNATSEKTKDFYNLLVTKNGEENWVAQVKSRANAANSDHFPFTMVGVPAVFVYTLGGKTGGYHAPDDIPEKASLSSFSGIFKLLESGLRHLR